MVLFFSLPVAVRDLFFSLLKRSHSLCRFLPDQVFHSSHRILIACLFLLLIPILASHAATVPRYDLYCTIVPEKRALNITGEVTLAGETNNRDALYFRLAEQMRDLEIQIVAPASLAGTLPLSRMGNEDGVDVWSVRLPTPLPKNQPMTLRFSYHGGEKTAFVFHIGSDGCYAGGTNTPWYPQFGSLNVQGNKKSIDTNGNAMGALHFTVPKGLIVLASGQRLRAETQGTQDRITFQVNQPTALSFAANHFIVKKRQGKFPIALYLLKERTDTEQFLDGIVRVVRELEKVYGPFPYPEFALGEVTDTSTEGAGFGGVGFGGSMLSTTSFLEEGFNLAFFSHEIGHQWWGNQITVAGDKGGYWLEEGLAQYGSLLCVDRIAGSAAAARYRREGYPGYIETQCGDGYLNLHAAGIDHNLEDANPDSGLAHELADNKGFLVWSMLADEIGANRLHAALQEITQKYAFGEVTYEKFLDIIEHHAGRKLDVFRDQWLRRTGAPVLNSDWSQDGNQITVNLHQTAPYYTLRVPVRVVFEDGSAVMVTMQSDSPVASKTISTKKRIAAVEIDPNFRILHYTPFTLERSNALKDITAARFYLQNNRTSEAQSAYRKAVSLPQKPDRYGLEFEVHLAKARFALVIQKDPATARKELEAALRCAVRPPLRLVRAYWMLLQAAIKLQDKELGAWAAESLLQQEKALKQETSHSQDARKYLDAPVP